MSAPTLTVPPPTDDDHEDVAWALRAASAQWRRQAVEDAVSWVKRAAETAHEVGAHDRSSELARLAIALANPVQAVAPPPPMSAAAPPAAVPPLPPPHGAMASRPSIEVEEIDFDVDVDLDEDEIEMLDEDDDDVEMVDEVEDVDGDGDDTTAFVHADSADLSAPAESPSYDDEAFDTEVDNPLTPDTIEVGSVSSTPPAAPSLRSAASEEVGSSHESGSNRRSAFVDRNSTTRSRPTTSSGLDRLPPSMRPRPSGLDLADNPDEESEIDADEFGELDFEEEAPTSRVSASSAPPLPDLGPISLAGPSRVPLEDSTAAEYAQSRAPLPSVEEHEELERELGIDLNVRFSARQASAPQAPAPPQAAMPLRGSEAPQAPGVSMSQAREPSIAHRDPMSPSSAPPGALDHLSPVPGRASVRPSRPPGGSDRVTSSEIEPYSLAPSAQLPPTTEIQQPREAAAETRLPPIEPPSRPRTAPPPAMMTEPEERPSQLPGVEASSLQDSSLRQSSRDVASSIPGPPSAPAFDSAPEDDEFDEMFAAMSRRPAALESSTGSTSSPSTDEAPPPPFDNALEDPASDTLTTIVDGLDVLDLDGLQDLAEDAAARLVASAKIVTLRRHEEVNDFGVALVTHGSVQMMPKVADAPCGMARKGEVLFTQGTLEETTQVRIVGAEDGTRVAVFSKEALSAATSESPWVADELAEVADRYLGFAGAVLGPLGDSLDDMFRFMVFEKCTVKSKTAGTIIAKGGQAMDGMYILGGGSLEILAEDGSVEQELAMGDFLFPETVLSASPASRTVRVGAGGALVLYANRMAAHELLATCPPFIELLAG